jgi:hypothetical protein
METNIVQVPSYYYLDNNELMLKTIIVDKAEAIEFLKNNENKLNESYKLCKKILFYNKYENSLDKIYFFQIEQYIKKFDINYDDSIINYLIENEANFKKIEHYYGGNYIEYFKTYCGENS